MNGSNHLKINQQIIQISEVSFFHPGYGLEGNTKTYGEKSSAAFAPLIKCT